VAAIFSRLDTPAQDLLSKLKRYLGKIIPKQGKTELSNNLKEALILSYLAAYNLGKKKLP